MGVEGGDRRRGVGGELPSIDDATRLSLPPLAQVGLGVGGFLELFVTRKVLPTGIAKFSLTTTNMSVPSAEELARRKVCLRL